MRRGEERKESGREGERKGAGRNEKLEEVKRGRGERRGRGRRE